MAKLLKLIVVIALLAGIYLMFFQKEWLTFDSQEFGVTAMAPAAGEKATESQQDQLLGMYKSESVAYVGEEGLFSVARLTSRKITHGNLSLSDYEKGTIKSMEKDYKFRYVSTKRLTYENVSGIEVKFFLPDGKSGAYTRLFPINDVVYAVSYISPSGLTYDYQRYRFFNSVKFTN